MAQMLHHTEHSIRYVASRTRQLTAQEKLLVRFMFYLAAIGLSVSLLLPFLLG
jgi:hypothetical protein